MVLALRRVFCTDLRTDSGLWFYTALTEVESVYCAVRTDSLYKAHYVLVLKRYIVGISKWEIF
jgi:hypothetical protein